MVGEVALALLPKAQPPGIAQARYRRVTKLWRDRQQTHAGAEGARSRCRFPSPACALPNSQAKGQMGERGFRARERTSDCMPMQPMAPQERPTFSPPDARHHVEPHLAAHARTPRRLHRTPHRPERCGDRHDAGGGRPRFPGSPDRRHRPGFDQVRQSTGHAGGDQRSRCAGQHPRHRAEEPGVPQLHRTGLLRHPHAERDPAQHS